MSRGFFLNARLGVNGSQNAARSFGTSAARGVVGSLGGCCGGHWRTSPREGLIGANDGSGANLCPVGESLSKDAGEEESAERPPLPQTGTPAPPAW